MVQLIVKLPKLPLVSTDQLFDLLYNMCKDEDVSDDLGQFVLEAVFSEEEVLERTKTGLLDQTVRMSAHWVEAAATAGSKIGYGWILTASREGVAAETIDGNAKRHRRFLHYVDGKIASVDEINEPPIDVA